jgi:hypothetical protein
MIGDREKFDDEVFILKKLKDLELDFPSNFHQAFTKPSLNFLESSLLSFAQFSSRICLLSWNQDSRDKVPVKGSYKFCLQALTQAKLTTTQTSYNPNPSQHVPLKPLSVYLPAIKGFVYPKQFINNKSDLYDEQ